MRKLASVQIIKDLIPAENSDNLLIAKILGWDVVVSKNDNYQVGDKVIFFEIDSFLPCIDEFEFLRKSCYKNSPILGEGLRLKSIRLRGNLSQGLIMKLETFFNQDEINDLKEDDDLTERLNIKKWEEPEPAVLGGNVAGRRPDFIKKTDEARCFDWETKINTDKGKMPIGKVVKNPNNFLVQSFNEQTNTYEWKRITDIFITPQKQFEKYSLITTEFRPYSNRTNTIKCSSNHPFYTLHGIKLADELSSSDLLLYPDNCYDDSCISAIYGMLLGDSSIQFENRKNKDGSLLNIIKIGFSQGEKQLDYLKYKLSLFSENIKIYENKSGYSDNKVYNACLKTDNYLNYIINNDIKNLSKNRRKEITKEFCNKLTPISFAFWYMDDGSISHVNDTTAGKQRASIRLATNSFSVSEINNLITRLDDFGIKASIRKDKNNQFNIFIGADYTPIFEELVAPYICDSMLYKLEEKYRKRQLITFKNMFVKKVINIPLKIINIEHKQIIKTNNNGNFYNIEVEANHNYIADGVLTHNCQRFPGLLEEFYNCPEVYGSVKIDGSSHSIGINKDNEFHATSHNMDLKLDDVKQGSFVDFCKKHDLENKLREIKEKKKLDEIVIQGEYAGPGIQKNKLELLQPNWYIFTADYNGKRVSLSELRELHHLLSVDIVPIVEILTGAAFKEKYPDEESILKRVEGNDSGLYKDGQQEGIVFRPTEPTYSKILKTDLSMKVINNEYLLKE